MNFKNKIKSWDRFYEFKQHIEIYSNKIKKIVYTFFSLNKFTALVYYIFLSPKFLREQLGVLHGKRKYLKDLDDQNYSSALLRRNIHRLEKGLLMQPRKDIFALDFIVETVRAYQALSTPLSEDSSVDFGEIKWAYDVLSEYFDVVKSHRVVDKAKEIFLRCDNSIYSNGKTEKFIPYKRDLTRNLIDYESILELSIRRRSVRWFKKKRVPRELVDKAIVVAAYAPSACNRQPFKFIIIESLELLEKVSALPSGTPGWNKNIPMMIVVVGQLNSYFDERDRHLPYIDGSLSSMSLLYALESLGLGSCCVNWPDIEHRERAMQNVLGLEPHERVVMCIAVGYPDDEGLVAYSKKKHLNKIREYR